ncbi:MAG: aspartate carbamoyltransferase catalytic subunit [Myxococcales bacterium]|nr:aspartate carbamoyltransferase catalytic subunit [Myxococcales bacterium]MDD9966904.1 aspartate carbamoyltransferase catalytic subunit [Myxococcales bacterium]
MAGFAHNHLLGIANLEREDITTILDAAEAFINVSRRPVRKVPALRGKTVINMFFEASTRTRTSFELAGKRLSADVVNVTGSGSSLSKGESLLDTCRTLEAMRPDIVVMRHNASGAPHYVARRVGCSVVNGGDGAHEHPTQALLDAYMIRHTFGTLSGLKVAICGDISHSRVARSNAALLNKFGSEVRLCGPRTLLPVAAETLGAKVYADLNEGIEGVNVIMLLRIQRERLEGALLPTMREYSRKFGVAQPQLDRAAPNAIVMHPGPMNRGVEIHPALADSERSVILDQVEAGVAVRMAVLYLLAKDQRGTSPEQAAAMGARSAES